MTGRWRRRLAALLRREDREAQLDEEVRFHLEMEPRDLIAAGLDPGEARRRARIAFGGVERHKERARETMGVRGVESFLEDARFGVRSMARSPGFTVSALLVLALGIGATTAIFSVVDGVLLRPLPYPQPHRLVRLYQASPSKGSLRGAHSLPNFRDWRERSTTVAEMGLYTTLPSGLILTGEGSAEELNTAYVAGGFFRALGEDAALGRTLGPEEELGDNRRVILGHGLWQGRFGGDPGIVGRILTLDHQPYQVAGVMPEGFAFPDPDIQAWVFLTVIPQGSIPTELRFVRFPRAVARLEAGVTPERAQEELSSIALALSEEHPDANAGLTAATVEPLHDVVVGDVRSALWIVTGAVGFILLIACTNVANLLLARSTERSREVAVRMSLGAGRWRVVRQLLTESLVLGLFSGALGLVVAEVGSGVLLAGAGGLLPRLHEVSVDGRVLLFGLAMTGVTTLIFGVLPALRSTDLALGQALREGRDGGTGRAAGALRRTLVAGEIAVALVLLVGSGLSVRSVGELLAVDPGFDVEGRVAMTLTISGDKYPERAGWMGFYHRLMEQVERLPEVDAVASVRRLPLGGGGHEQSPIRVPGLYEPAPEEQAHADLIQVSSGLFQTLGTELVAGRSFTARDGPDDPLAVVVNEALVRRYFQGREAVGHVIELGGDPLQVVGVVEDVHHSTLDQEPIPTAYVHQEQIPRIGMAIVARTSGDPGAAMAGLRRVVESMDPDQPITGITSLESAIYDSVGQPRFFALLLASFAALAVVLSAVGIYGVISYAVRQRTREIGLRMALGARSGDVTAMVVRQGMVPAVLGMGVGLSAALVLSRLMDALLFQVSPADLATYVGAGLLLGAVALAACAMPARSAARMDPMHALRGG